MGLGRKVSNGGTSTALKLISTGLTGSKSLTGHASLTYGSDALAGVVNLIPTQPAPEGKMIGDITADYRNQ